MAVVISGSGIDMGGNPVSNVSIAITVTLGVGFPVACWLGKL